MKKIGLVFLALVLMVSLIGAYHYSQQMTDEEKRTEILSLLKKNPEDLADILESADLVNILKPLELQTRSDGKYDYSSDLVGLAGSDPKSLTDRVRAIEVRGLNKKTGWLRFSQRAVGFIYNEKYVVAPIQAFYKKDPYFGMIPGWQLPEITLKAFLLADPGKEDDWKVEELGEIHFNEELFIAVIERVEPIIEVSPTPYTFGKFEDVAVGNFLYQVEQSNRRASVEVTWANQIFTDKEGRNLISTQGDLMLIDLGSLLFAVRDGKPELIGMICVMKEIEGVAGMVYVYVLDINQIVDFVEKVVRGSKTK